MNITLPPAALIQPIYDFKNIFELAFGNVFVAAGLTVAVSSGIMTPAQPVPQPEDFQTIVPRTELKFTAGAGTKAALSIVNGIRFNATFSGVLTVRAITNSNLDGKTVHATYRAQLAYMCGIMGSIVNGSIGGLTMHKVHEPITQTGTSDVFKTSDGFEWSEQNFNLDFSVLPSAFQTLAT